MAYSKTLAKKYATNRDRYRSADNFLSPFFKKTGIKGKAILDFGCGDGPESARFISLGAKKIVGIDPSAEMVRLAKERKLPNTTFVNNDGVTIPLKNNQFDLVYARFVLHYIKDLKSQFVEIERVLKRGGYFLAIFQCLTNDPKLVNKSVPINLGQGKNMIEFNIFAKSPDEVKNAVEEAQLKLTKLLEVENKDAQIDSKYKFKHKFKKTTYILLAQKS